MATLSFLLVKLFLGYALLWSDYLAAICDAFLDGLFMGETLLFVLLPSVYLLSRLGFETRGAICFFEGDVAMV